ncbi:MAG: DNA polymerase III subunit gamma/tau [Holosporales bacterium]|jgi:DNA polymerase-3 subunit gamma/tau|nr:DNA polymerase III subunit gamma/tau [Holosporales bacterium]
MVQPLLAHRAFALKYRPQLFADLIGQDLAVRLLTNGLVKQSLGSAVLFTGTRGVGKTTLARLLARALTCPQRDPVSAEPCGTCETCTSILGDQQLDVIEMDAASHTGVEDVRAILDACPYKPVACTHKVYIIDEVHMLSKSAFNALLKTLEEPPPYVQFLFATTEVDRVPETVLSRCLRLDLRPVETDLLAQHMAGIAQKEHLEMEPLAFTLLARAARGSVRDALSLLERASYIGRDTLTVLDVRALLGLSDESRLEDLLTACIQGETVTTLRLLRTLCSEGASAKEVLVQVLQALHVMTCFLVEAPLIEDMLFSETVLAHLKGLAQRLSVPAVSRLWAIFSKGLEEVMVSPSPELSSEMVFVRAGYTAPLPDLHALLQENSSFAEERAPYTPEQPAPSGIHSFQEVLSALESRKEVLLLEQITHGAQLVSFKPGAITLHQNGVGAAQDVPAKLSKFLSQRTGSPWAVTWSAEEGAPVTPVREPSQQRLQEPLAKQVVELFPGAVLDSGT